ncbi:MAG TPA: hypothetical protein VI757_10140 [Bacteroidia bacterium]|nr:hypothetical protein [Bacteroidia bacterium]
MLNFTKPITSGLFWGIAGGLLLILTIKLTHIGWYEIVPYPIVLIVALMTFKPEDKKNIRVFFLAGFFTFIIMTLVLYIEIITIENPPALLEPLWGHLWRLGLMAAIGAVSSFILTFLILFFRNARQTA